MGFIRFILGVFIFMFFVRILVYYVLPWFVKRKLEKMQGTQENYNNKKEGEVTIDNSTSNKDKEYKGKSDIGEYTDFEEVD